VRLNPVVTRGLDPRVHLLRKNSKCIFLETMDCRGKPGNDGRRQILMSSATSSCGAECVIQPEEA
jgi:hypothetical protein